MADHATTPITVTDSGRWLARLVYVAAFAAVVLLLVGGRSSLAVLAVGVLGLTLTLAGAWWFLSHRGPVRWLSAALAVAGPTVVIVLYTSRNLLWAVLWLSCWLSCWPRPPWARPGRPWPMRGRLPAYRSGRRRPLPGLS